MFKKLNLTTLLLLCSSVLNAGGYMGLGVGLSTYNQDEFTDLNFSLSNNDQGYGYKFYLGYEINDYLALEGAYNNLGTAKSTNSTNDFSSELTSISLSGILKSPSAIGGISPFIKVGYGQLTSRFNFSNVAADEEIDSVLNLQYGLGFDYNFNGFFTRFEYEVFGETGEDGTTAGSIINNNLAQLVQPTQFSISFGKNF